MTDTGNQEFCLALTCFSTKNVITSIQDLNYKDVNKIVTFHSDEF